MIMEGLETKEGVGRRKEGGKGSLQGRVSPGTGVEGEGRKKCCCGFC